MTIVGLDPGTRKVGFAVTAEGGGPPISLGIVPVEGLEARLRELVPLHGITLAAVGQGTNASAVTAIVRAVALPMALVDERETTLLARARFFADHPPRGWRRLLPRGMMIPDRPIDDYAALLIAERYLARVAAAP